MPDMMKQATEALPFTTEVSEGREGKYARNASYPVEENSGSTIVPKDPLGRAPLLSFARRIVLTSRIPAAGQGANHCVLWRVRGTTFPDPRNPHQYYNNTISTP